MLGSQICEISTSLDLGFELKGLGLVGDENVGSLSGLGLCQTQSGHCVSGRPRRWLDDFGNPGHRTALGLSTKQHTVTAGSGPNAVY